MFNHILSPGLQYESDEHDMLDSSLISDNTHPRRREANAAKSGSITLPSTNDSPLAGLEVLW